VTPVVSGLQNPWSLAFLPDARMLVTGRMGKLWLLSADGLSVREIGGVPAVTATSGQGGLLDVVLDPDFARNRYVYLSYAEADSGNPSLNGTAVARAELDLDAPSLLGLSVIYRQAPKVASAGHFGSRLVFGRDGHLFVTLGDRQSNDQRGFAQDLSRGNGKVVRILSGGGAAPGNPFAGTPGAQPEIWSYGHRNPQGAALHPVTGELWTSEHGPQGGDEVNRTLAGRNHGWPVISYGQEYGTTIPVGEGTSKAGMEQPVSYWEMIDGSTWVSGFKSSTAPSGLAFFTGSTPAHWNGSLFLGALAGKALWRLQLDGVRVVGRERLLTGLNERIRDVRMGPDGHLWLLTDGSSGRLLRVDP
jgi:glucose/arabinose dehydrogenase